MVNSYHSCRGEDSTAGLKIFLYRIFGQLTTLMSDSIGLLEEAKGHCVWGLVPTGTRYNNMVRASWSKHVNKMHFWEEESLTDQSPKSKTNFGMVLLFLAIPVGDAI